MIYNDTKEKYSHHQKQNPYFPNSYIPLLDLNKQPRHRDKKKSSIATTRNKNKLKKKQLSHGTSDPRLELASEKVHKFKHLASSQQYPQNRMLLSSKIDRKRSQMKQPRSKHHSPHSNSPHDTRTFQNSCKAYEEITEEENKNLKEQNQYLLKTIRGMKKKEKLYLERIYSYQSRIQQLEKENMLQKQQYAQVKKYVIEGIYRMENIVQKDSIVSSQQDGKQIQKGTGLSDSTNENLSDIIENLNEKFDQLISSYQKTNNPEYRKQYVELAKKIKRLKLMKSSKDMEFFEKNPRQYDQYSRLHFERE